MSVEALNLLSEKLGDGWVVAGWWPGGWVVSTEIKDWTEPINYYILSHNICHFTFHVILCKMYFYGISCVI